MKQLQITVKPIPKIYSEKVNSLVEKLWNYLAENKNEAIRTETFSFSPTWKVEGDTLILQQIAGIIGGGYEEYKVAFDGKPFPFLSSLPVVSIFPNKSEIFYMFMEEREKSFVWFYEKEDKAIVMDARKMDDAYEQQAIAFLESLVDAIKQTQKDTK